MEDCGNILYFTMVINNERMGDREICSLCYLSTDAYSVCVYGEKSEKPNATPNITPSVTPGAGSIVPPGTGAVKVPGGSADAAPSPTVAPSESVAPTPGTESSDVPNPDVTLVPGINPSENPGTTIAPTSEPVAEPKITPSPSNVPTVSPGEKQPETTQTPSRTKEYPKKNTKLEDSKTGNVYKVTKVGKSVDLLKVSGKKIVSVKIPAMVNLRGITYQVTGIEKNVFNNCKYLKKVTIGNKVKLVGEKAFYNCKNLTRIVIGESVTKIEKKAFARCKKVKTIVIKSEKLKNIGKSAFKQVRNSSKVSVQVPKNKYVAYRKLLQNRGIGKKVRIIKV